MLINLCFLGGTVQFCAYKEVVFIHSCTLLIACCTVAVSEDFDMVQVCSETIMTSIEPKICNWLFSGFAVVDLLWVCCLGIPMWFACCWVCLLYTSACIS